MHHEEMWGKEKEEPRGKTLFRVSAFDLRGPRTETAAGVRRMRPTERGYLEVGGIVERVGLHQGRPLQCALPDIYYI